MSNSFTYSLRACAGSVALLAGLVALSLFAPVEAKDKAGANMPIMGGSYGHASGARPAYNNHNNRYTHRHRGHSHRYYGGGYYYSGWSGIYGGWYRPGLYLGVTVPVLTLGYTTRWYGGTPYYRHENVYDLTDRDGYRVVDRPRDEPLPDGPAPVVAAPPVLNGPAPVYTQQEKTGQLFAYPRNGQSATTATFDRIECEKWGTQQTGYQPGQSAENAEKKSAYQRAVAACLEGRGYSVR